MSDSFSQPSKYTEQFNRFYDAFYWILYGIIAARQVPVINGELIGQAVRKLLSGPEQVTPGTEAFNIAGARIATGVTGTFFGATGKPDFDPATGARPTYTSLACFKTVSFGVYSVVHDTYRYDGDAGALVPYQNPFCFPFF